MTDTVAASVGDAGHATPMATTHHFGSQQPLPYISPRPTDVGAYQIIIQPNLFSQQITGFHHNAPLGAATHANAELNLTGQQWRL